MQEAVITRLLRHLTLVSIPPPITPARVRQATCAWVASAYDGARGLVGDVRATEGCLMPEEPSKSHPAPHVQAALRTCVVDEPN